MLNGNIFTMVMEGFGVVIPMKISKKTCPIGVCMKVKLEKETIINLKEIFYCPTWTTMVK